MFGQMLAGTGSVNGQTVPASGVSFTVHNGDVVTIGGSASSTVSITNQGANTVHAACDLALASPAPNSLFSFDFQPNVAQSIPNPLGSSINLKFTITSSDASDVMVGKMLAGTGSVNGQTVPASGVSFTVHNGDVVTIGGSASSTVSITNQGANTVHAACDLALASPAPNSLMSFDFQPNAAQSIPNPLGSDITLKCTITGTDASDVLYGKMVSGTGSVNGQTISPTGTSFTVHNGDVLTIAASGSGELSLTNQGANTVHAACDLAATLGASNSFLSFDFQPSTAKSIPNPIGVDLTLKCTLTSTDATDSLVGKMVSGTGSVNGQNIPATGLSFTVKNGDVVTIESTAGSELSILNQGSSNVHADCDLAHSLETHVTILDSLKTALGSYDSYDFVPNVPQTISNPLFWGISASCTLTSPDASDVLTGKMTAGNGTLNGQVVPAEGLTLTIKNNDVLAITCSEEAGVELTNLGTSTVHAQCGLTLGERDKKEVVQMLTYLLEKVQGAPEEQKHHKKHHKKHHRKHREEGIEREVRKVVYRFRKWRKSD